jgi:hypothetical protein
LAASKPRKLPSWVGATSTRVGTRSISSSTAGTRSRNCRFRNLKSSGRSTLASIRRPGVLNSALWSLDEASARQESDHSNFSPQREYGIPGTGVAAPLACAFARARGEGISWRSREPGPGRRFAALGRRGLRPPRPARGDFRRRAGLRLPGSRTAWTQVAHHCLYIEEAGSLRAYQRSTAAGNTLRGELHGSASSSTRPSRGRDLGRELVRRGIAFNRHLARPRDSASAPRLISSTSTHPWVSSPEAGSLPRGRHRARAHAPRPPNSPAAARSS